MRRGDIMSSEVRRKIMAAIESGADVPQPTLLAFLLMTFDELGNKIDTILRDEKGRREDVLRSYADDHDQHHEWLSRQITIEQDRRAVCDWAAERMADEIENKSSKRRIRDSLAEKIIWAVLSGATVYLATRL